MDFQLNILLLIVKIKIKILLTINEDWLLVWES